MTTQAIASRLTALSDAHKQTLQFINRLAKLPIQPGSSSLDSDEADARLELSAEIHQSLKDQEEEFELLRQESEDLINSGSWGSASRRRDGDNQSSRTALAAQVARLGEDLKLARRQFRKAQLQAKRNAESAKQKERELLFAGVQDGSNTPGGLRRRGQEKLSQDELLLAASADVTSELRRLHQLGQTELSKGQFVRETLQQSKAALNSLTESYSNLDTLLSSSRTLVSTLIHSQKSDTWYLETAFYILASTILWLIFRRLLYGPLWWFLWFPIKLFFRITVGTFAAVIGVFGGASSSSSLPQASDRISTSLIIKPSAKGGIPRFERGMAQPSFAVGGGGAGAKIAQPGQAIPRSADDDSISNQVRTIAEESRRQGECGDASSEQSEQGTVLRERTEDESRRQGECGDASSEQSEQSTVLRERTEDEQPNRKKRMWEENIEVSKQGDQQRDEL